MYTYIIIDDESLIRKGTIKKLQPIQDKVTCIGEAANGKEALELIEASNPDIIITDMNMPVLDGGQLLSILTERYPDKRIIVISGYKDFEYMKQAISAQAVDYILKPFHKEELQKSVLNAISIIDSSAAIQNQLISSSTEKEYARYEYDIAMLKNIILGYHTADATLTSKKLQIINQTHNLILITLHSTDPLDEDMVHTFLTENGFGDLALYLRHIHNDNLGFFILFTPEQSVLNAETFCKQIIGCMTASYRLTDQEVSFGISMSHSDLLHLHTAFTETVIALNTKGVNAKNNFYFYKKNELAATHIEWNKEAEFLFRIETGVSDKVTELLEDLFKYFTSLDLYTLADVKYYLFQLTDKVKNIMAEYFDQVSSGQVSSSMQNILNSMFTLSELKVYYLQFFTNITDLLREHSVYAIDDTIEKIKIYVQRNYQNNLTIEFISSLFYMNRSYCSHIFHTRTNEKFIDYVNRVRIKKAKELLDHSDKKIYQIAKSVGYDNVKYFFRVFKKLQGITPEQYRNR